MGVPKFYRWISERYPCLSQVIQEHQIPDFDNLYLDMNGIIHPCSHPNDDDPHFRKTEEDIFADIFQYIEVLFRIIKPKKVFFMAVDGVAPRAKMNQQRGRRFRSAKEAEDNIRKALEKGQVLPEEERFDSNCITPGTPFMVRLHEQLKFFVNYKISTDPAWQGLRIYLSGHETPGEGEHKIMEFIRSEKVCPDYDPNTRHCLYGLDADLLMLGLSSHEPHFSLLREEVRFGKAAKRITKAEKTTFHLLHLSLFREYLDWEFSELKDKLPFPYDLERIIDDWILMGFLVGNDFIPHLPNLHINHDALPYLYRVYIDVMPSLDGFLHDGGKLILSRFEKYLVGLSKFDREQFEEKFVDMKWFESKKGFTFGNDPVQKDDSLLTLDNSFAALELMPGDSMPTKAKQPKRKVNPELEKLAAKFDEDLSDDDEDIFETEFAMLKRDYYMQKLGYEEINRDVMAEQTFQYVTGIQWILSYYFSGVPSWSWFYPFHYAPYMSDIRNFSELDIKFELGTPFVPFEQLLAVLPAASRQLLPKPFQNLMIMEQSDIIEYYPVNFKTDLNGKQQEWEAVVLIPFIDERRLLDAMSPLYSRLTEEEITRNKHGPCLLYTYDPSLSFFCPSSLPGKFPDICCCHARCEVLNKDVFLVDVQLMSRGLCEGVKLDVYYPGFPTLHHISHKAEFKKASVKVFQMHSKGKSLILQITKPQGEVSSLEISEELLGETCYVGWPHMVEALVMGVCDGSKRYFLENKNSHNSSKEIAHQVLTELEIKSWKHQVKSMAENQLERRGIELGETNVLIEACPIRGKRYVCGAKGLVTMEKEWSPMPISYPHQLTVKDIHVHESHEDDKIHTIEELFPIGSQCFMLASPYYGASGEVIEIDVKQSRVRVQLHVPVEPDISSVIDRHQALTLHYLPAYVVAKKLGITPNLLSRITGSFLISHGSSTDASGGGKKLDIGLNMKFSKQNKEVLGFARRTEEGGWTFSPTARKTIAEYLKKFPQLFESLARMPSNDRCFAKDLDTDDNGGKPLSEVQDWLKTIPTLNLEPVKCGSISLDEPVVEAVEEAVLQTKTLNQKPKTVKVRVRPHLLFTPSEHLGAVLPDNDASFELFDRVVNVKLNAAVPFGLRGTIIGIHQGDDSSDVLYEVVFDEPFLGGLPLRCSSNKVYLMTAASLINVSYGDRCEAKKVEEKSAGRGQQPGGSAAFSPSLGASPELGKKNKNMKYKSADVSLDSPGPSGFGRGMSPNTPYGGGFGPSNGFNTRGSPLQLKSSPNSANSKTKQRTPVIQARGSPQAQINTYRTVEGTVDDRMSTPPRFQKISRVPTDKPNNGPSEFADMWKELKLKENSASGSSTDEHREPDDRGKETRESDTLIKDGTQALRELLQIGQPHKDVMEKPQAKPEPALRGKQLSLDELFCSQSSAQATVQQIPQVPLPYPSGSLPSLALLTWCRSVGLPPPYYHHTPGPQGVIAIVELANGFKFPGSACRDQGEAVESAASVAVFQLPRIMPNIPSPQHIAMQQQFSPGFFSSLPHPVIPPAFAGLASLSSPRQIIHQQLPQSQASIKNPRTTGAPSRETLAQQGVNPVLNISAVPFIPLQVSRRSSSHQQSPAKPQETAVMESPVSGPSIEDTKVDEIQQEEQIINSVQQTTDEHEDVSNTLLSGLSANNSCAPSDSSLPVQRTEKAGASFKRTPNSSKRLLAPSFFSKKS
ncbi:5'-3' exoribonuclease 1 [Desmophyllum pertusum]|uniref:5'-3' exoribonuclease 1 n=1 Tax=Desmophyllum pertusum TaxID=174260 RepID=A0A9X0DBQ1_9CNID|nr:5'-3' exoribonuclease 1 [Desmophyllum pertusum]